MSACPEKYFSTSSKLFSDLAVKATGHDTVQAASCFFYFVGRAFSKTFL